MPALWVAQEGNDFVLHFDPNIETIEPEDLNIIAADMGRITKIDGRGLTKLQTIPRNAFKEMNNLREADFSGCTDLTVVGENSFYNCPNLERVNFSNCNRLREISWFSFADCKNLQEVDCSGCQGIKEIEQAAFACCSSLKRLNIPPDSKLETIEQDAFVGCNKYNLDIMDCKNLSYIEKGSLKGCATDKKAVNFAEGQAERMVAQSFINNQEFFKDNKNNDEDYYATQMSKFCEHVFGEKRTDMYNKKTISFMKSGIRENNEPQREQINLADLAGDAGRNNQHRALEQQVAENNMEHGGMRK